MDSNLTNNEAQKSLSRSERLLCPKHEESALRRLEHFPKVPIFQSSKQKIENKPSVEFDDNPTPLSRAAEECISKKI